MKDPRLVEIEFLSAIDRERPSSLTLWDWAKRLSVEQDFVRDMVFQLFKDGCLQGTSSIAVSAGYTDIDKLGQVDVERSVRTVLSGANSFSACLNHAGRVRLFRLQDEIAKARIRDSFGLLWDHRHWSSDLLIRLAVKDPTTTSVVLFIDVDDFKAVNTKAGYEVGNQVLRIVFQTVLNRVTGVGEAYRWGGDEIAVLLPDANRDLGERIGEAIRADVERECGAYSGLVAAGVTTTVSVGVGAFRGRPSADEVTTKVSELMKNVKSAGKNSVLGADL
jgi:diguanylate cyclase (GGDEF)-like protein